MADIIKMAIDKTTEENRCLTSCGLCCYIQLVVEVEGKSLFRLLLQLRAEMRTNRDTFHYRSVSLLTRRPENVKITKTDRKHAGDITVKASHIRKYCL